MATKGVPRKIYPATTQQAAQPATAEGGRRCPVYGTKPPTTGCERCVFSSPDALENAARAGVRCALNPEAGA